MPTPNQLLGFIRCPRHRLPALNPETYKLECVHHHFTLINATLRVLGPMNEEQLTNTLVMFQMACSAFAFFVRYTLASFFF